MNKNLKRLIILLICIVIFIIGYKVPFWQQKPIPEPTPIEDLKPLPRGSESYIKDGVLYTSVKAIPLSCIIKIEYIEDGIPFVIIHYTFSKYRWGMLAMSYQEYKKLFGDPNVKT